MTASTGVRPGRKVRQKPSHARLIADAEASSTRPTRLDAVVVPASRPASVLAGHVEMSAAIGAVLVVLASHKTNIGQIADRVASVPGARALLVDVRGMDTPEWASSGERFRTANAGRQSNLSAKRNRGLEIARLHGWRKIAFVDDDIALTRPASLARMAEQLESKPVAGMICRDFPDNSVVCHARRLAGLRQDNFVTGAVLGVNCADIPVPFFPDVYNEDWLFFAQPVFHRELVSVGEASQAPYDPFATPMRARFEEFGDVIAEGLYTLIEDGDPHVPFADLLRSATTAFWEEFIEARRTNLERTAKLLGSLSFDDSRTDEAFMAYASVVTATDQLSMITSELCCAFVNAWQHDVADWTSRFQRLSVAGNTHDVMDAVGATAWRIARFGEPVVEATRLPILMGSRSSG